MFSCYKQKEASASFLFQTVEKAVIPQVDNSKNKIVKYKRKNKIQKEAQGNHEESLVLTCFFRSYTLSY